MKQEKKFYVEPKLDVYEMKTQKPLLEQSDENLSRELNGFGEDNE